MSTTVSTYGLHLIVQAAENVTARTDFGSDEYEAVTEEIDRIRDLFADESFVEWIVFTKEVCDRYDVAEQYPAEQREAGISDARDWRDGVRMGFWHILDRAIRQQCSDPKRITVPQTATGTESETSEAIDPETWTDDRTVDDVTSDYVTEKTLNVTITAPDVDAVLQEPDVPVTDPPYSFIQYIIAMDIATEQYDLETWPGMTDTVVREGVSYGHYCWNVVTTILPELAREASIPDRVTA